MSKKRISITIDDDVLKKLDFYSKSNSVENRSLAIENLLKGSLSSKIPRKVVILCGGLGTRLRPLTYEIPKAMLPVQGKPVIEHLFDLFKKHGIYDMILSVGYLKEKIKEHYGNGHRFGVNVSYIEENKPLGTAGPLSMVGQAIKETFFVCNGDLLYNIDLEKMFELHKKTDALITISLTTVDDPAVFGVARLDGSRIIEFIEKPKNPPSNLINAGLYIMEPEVFDLIPHSHSMLERDVFPKIAKKGRLCGFPFSGQWFDMGTPERYETAIKNWKGVK